jgi:hypothetical protein
MSGGVEATPGRAAPASKKGATRQRRAASLSVHIGTTAENERVLWEPNRPGLPLNNFGLLVTGDSGVGKTQVLRAVIAAVAAEGLPLCVFDFKNDYADPGFSGAAGLRVHDVDRFGLPFNPLSLVPDELGEAEPMRQIHELAAILGRIFSLGDQQQARMKKAMRAAFEERGIAPGVRHEVAKIKEFPSFEEVVRILKADETKNEALLNRLAPLFDLNLFPESRRVAMTFEQMLREQVVLDLHALPNDKIKAAIAEFIIVRLHGHLLRGEQPRELRRLLVFDEAWRVGESERLQELAREGRAFGLGIAIGTQFPGDIPENLSGNLATQLLLQNNDVEHRKAVARTLCGTSSGAAAVKIIKQIDRLKKHEGFFRNQHHSPYVLVETLPHYKRAKQ